MDEIILNELNHLDTSDIQIVICMCYRKIFFISKNFISADCMSYRINSIHTCGIQEINFTVKQLRRIYKKLK